jgi:hypothetical protein
MWVFGGYNFLSTLKLWSLTNIEVAKKCNGDVHVHIHIWSYLVDKVLCIFDSFEGEFFVIPLHSTFVDTI